MNLIEELKKYQNLEKQPFFPKFFKAGKGEYGEGDKFLGISVPDCRKVAKLFKNIPLDTLKPYLANEYHEVRLTAVLILVDKYSKDKENVCKFYLENLKGINNWDLVDQSAPKILGEYLKDKVDRQILYKFAHSKDLWEKRIAILSTFAFIKNSDFKDVIAISQILLHDKHDLIHKAVGWMLREMGKKDMKELEDFLKKHASVMPRTMLRYSIEKFDENKRKYYMNL